MSLLPFPISINPTGLASLLFSGLEQLEGDLAKSLVADVIDNVVPATTSLGSPEGNWFVSVSHLLLPIEELVVGPLLFAATIGAVIRQDMRRLARAWAVGLPVALLAGYAVVALAQKGLQVTDAISQLVQDQVEPNLKQDFVNAVTLGVTQAVSTGPIGALVSAVVIFGGLLVWLELALRSAAVELAVFFMPLALAGLVWPSTAHWPKRLAEVLVSLMLAKPVVVGALCLGTNALTSGQSGAEAVVTGAAILLMAAFAPVALFKLVPLAEASTVGHIQELSRQPFRSAERAAGSVSNVMSRAAALAGAGGLGGGVSVGAGQMLAQVSEARGPSEALDLGPGGTPKAAPAGPPARLANPPLVGAAGAADD